MKLKEIRIHTHTGQFTMLDPYPRKSLGIDKNRIESNNDTKTFDAARCDPSMEGGNSHRTFGTHKTLGTSLSESGVERKEYFVYYHEEFVSTRDDLELLGRVVGRSLAKHVYGCTLSSGFIAQITQEEAHKLEGMQEVDEMYKAAGPLLPA